MVVQSFRSYYEYRSTREGNSIYELLEHLDEFATEFCELYDTTCCTREDYKHLHYQCKHNSDPIIAAYTRCKFICQDIKQVEEYVIYFAAHELESIVNENFDTSHEERVMKGHASIILQICINEFSDNEYVINYNERILAAIESARILEKEHVVQSKLGDVWEPL